MSSAAIVAAAPAPGSGKTTVAVAGSSLHEAGTRVTGHEFHRTAVEFASETIPAWAHRLPDGSVRRDGAACGGVHASYLPTHPAAHPRSVRRFVAHAAPFKLAG